MNRCLVLIALLGLLASAPISRAQQDSGTAASKESDPPPQLENGTILYLELSKTVDAKKARIGDEISGFLLTDVVSHGKLAVRKYAKILGHVTEVQAKTKENPESRLGITFDRIQAKHTAEIRVSTVLLAIRSSQRLQTEPPPMMGTRGPNAAGARESDLSYAGIRSLSSSHSRLGQQLDPPMDSRPADNRARMQLLEIEGLSLVPSRDGSDKIVVSVKRTVSLESRMRMELRVSNKTR